MEKKVENLAEGNLIFKYFPDTPEIRVIDFLITHEGFAYSKTEVAREVGISPITCTKIWERLVKEGKILKVKQIGRAELYKLNVENHGVKTLMELFNHIIMSNFERVAQMQKEVVIPLN